MVMLTQPTNQCDLISFITTLTIMYMLLCYSLAKWISLWSALIFMKFDILSLKYVFTNLVKNEKKKSHKASALRVYRLYLALLILQFKFICPYFSICVQGRWLSNSTFLNIFFWILKSRIKKNQSNSKKWD